jgi:hypothetical protein
MKTGEFRKVTTVSKKIDQIDRVKELTDVGNEVEALRESGSQFNLISSG